MTQTLTAALARAAVDLYKSLAAATFFRGQTGLGFVVDHQGTETVGPISQANGIWKPMTFFVIGGERHGRRMLNAADIKKAVETFKAESLWSLLRVTSGKGIAVANSMAQLVDARHARSQVSFELTHFGGRSLVPCLNVELGQVQDAGIEWKGGFVYQAPGNKPARAGEPLVLSRILGEEDWKDDAALERVWEDLEKEARRLQLLNCSDRISSSREESGGEIRAFLVQELTALMPGSRVDEKPGYDYEVRKDGVVTVRRTIRPGDAADEAVFTAMLEAFRKECHRVYAMHCQPLSDGQRQKLGRPGDDSFAEVVGVEDVSFNRDDRRSTSQREELIGWGSGRAPHFPYEGWMPPKGKTFRVFTHRWGKGFRCSPAAPRLEERLTQKDTTTASKQLVEVAFDGKETVLSEEPMALQSEEKAEQSEWSTSIPAETITATTVTVKQTRSTWIGVYREVVRKGYGGGDSIQWERVETKDQREHAREYNVSVVGLTTDGGDSGYYRKMVDPALASWRMTIQGTDLEGRPYSTLVSLSWAQVPAELQADHEKRWPLCACRAARFDAASRTQCESCEKNLAGNVSSVRREFEQHFIFGKLSNRELLDEKDAAEAEAIWKRAETLGSSAEAIAAFEQIRPYVEKLAARKAEAERCAKMANDAIEAHLSLRWSGLSRQVCG